MIASIDTNFLVYWFKNHNLDCDIKHKIDYFIENITKAKGKIIIPMPCFAEFLVSIDDSAMDWMSGLEGKKSILIAPFDRKSAFECALLDKAAIGSGNKRGGRPISDAWQKIKIDRQIVSISKVNNATIIISGDAGLRATAMGAGIHAKTIEELELPEYAKQHKLQLVAPQSKE